jgi:hypothetical protein
MENIVVVSSPNTRSHPAVAILSENVVRPSNLCSPRRVRKTEGGIWNKTRHADFHGPASASLDSGRGWTPESTCRCIFSGCETRRNLRSVLFPNAFDAGFQNATDREGFFLGVAPPGFWFWPIRWRFFLQICHQNKRLGKASCPAGLAFGRPLVARRSRFGRNGRNDNHPTRSPFRPSSSRPTAWEGRRRRVAAALVAFHVAAHAKRLAAARVRTLERLLACVAVRVDAQAAGPRESLLARRAHVAILRLGEA